MEELMNVASVRLALPLVLASFLAQGCVYVTQKVREEKELEVDQDGDGAPFAGPNADCDDLDKTRTPGAVEIPYDGIDNDCKGDADLVDVDGDGFPGITREEWEANRKGSGSAGRWPDEIADDVPIDCLDADVVDDEGNVVLSAIDIFPGNNAGDVPYDGIDSNCDQSNDFDLDKDEFLPDVLPNNVNVATADAFEDYVTLWGYTGRLAAWFPETGAPRFGDCDDGDANAFPSDAEDVPYDGDDTNCDGENDFDPDGDGYMPPTTPSGDPTQPAFNAFVNKYDLSFVLPEPISGNGLPVDDPDAVVLGPFDDCLDLGDVRVGAASFNAASIYPRAYTAQFGDNGDIPYDGVDTDCNRDNDYDFDRDAFNAIGVEADYEGYIAFWGYGGEKGAWADVNSDVNLAEPGEGDCEDTLADTYPAALERIGDGEDQDCDGDGNAAKFWFRGSTISPELNWSRPGTPRVTRLGDVFAVVLMAESLSQPNLGGGATAANAGLAIPFIANEARSQATPSQPPFQWKPPTVTQEVVGPLDLITLDRCQGPKGEEVAYVGVQYVVRTAGNGYFGWYALTTSSSGLSIVNADVSAPYGQADVSIGFAPIMFSNDMVIGLDGDCEPFVAGVADSVLYVTHGRDASLQRYLNPAIAGDTLVASYDTPVAGSPPEFGFVACQAGVCDQLDFSISGTGAPQLDLTTATADNWSSASSTINKVDEQVTVAVPEGLPGLEVLVEGAPPFTILAGYDVLTGHAQLQDGTLYVAAIVDDGTDVQVVLAYGVPGAGPLNVTPLTIDPNDLPTGASGALPSQVGIFVDADRVAVALSMQDPVEPADGEYPDAVGWVFLGPPTP